MTERRFISFTKNWMTQPVRQASFVRKHLGSAAKDVKPLQSEPNRAKIPWPNAKATDYDQLINTHSEITEPVDGTLSP